MLVGSPGDTEKRDPQSGASLANHASCLEGQMQCERVLQCGPLMRQCGLRCDGLAWLVGCSGGGGGGDGDGVGVGGWWLQWSSSPGRHISSSTRYMRTWAMAREQEYHGSSAEDPRMRALSGPISQWRVIACDISRLSNSACPLSLTTPSLPSEHPRSRKPPNQLPPSALMNSQVEHFNTMRCPGLPRSHDPAGVPCTILCF